MIVMHTRKQNKLRSALIHAMLIAGVFVMVFAPVYLAHAENIPSFDLPENNPGQQNSPGGGGNPILPNPLKAQTLLELMQDLALLVMQIGLYVAIVFVIYSGFLFVTARGSEEKIKTARETFKYTMLGIFILFGARVLVEAVVNTIRSL